MLLIECFNIEGVVTSDIIHVNGPSELAVSGILIRIRYFLLFSGLLFLLQSGLIYSKSLKIAISLIIYSLVLGR